MPGRAASSRVVNADDDVQDAAAMRSLRFNQPLSWRAGKAIAIAELHKRLDALAAELGEIDQEEEDFDKASLVVTAGELAQANLFAHRDKGVRALTACCLVDIFRICAPDAPFDIPQMQGVFDLFVSYIIPLLQDPADPYNARHLHVLDSLSEYKTIILLGDLPRPDSLILKLFHTCFDILANPAEGLSKNVEYRLSGLLQTMVEECETLPAGVVDIILSQFLRADPRGPANATAKAKRPARDASSDGRQSQLQFRQLPPAYHAAKNICNSCVERMSRLVSQYFSNVIIDASNSRDKAPAKSKSKPKSKAKAGSDMDMSDNEGLDDPSENDLKELEKAHRLLREVWRCSPGVLQNVIPQVEAELSAENTKLRKLATEAIGDMISGIGAAGPPSPPVLDPTAYPPLSFGDATLEKPKLNGPNKASSSLSFAQSHPITYQNFMGRRNDKAAEIRAAWALKICQVLSTSAGGLGLGPHDERDMAQSLAQLLIDSDESVRIAGIEALTLLEFSDVVTKLGSLGGVSTPGSVLHNLADRVKDRKHAVRVSAAELLGKWWGVGAGEIASDNDQISSLFGQIPSKILNAVYANEIDINCLVDDVLFDSLIPLGYPNVKKKETVTQKSSQAQKASNSDTTELDVDKIRTERLLVVARDLDQKAKSVLLALMGRPSQLSNYMKAFLKRCEDYNGGVMDDNAAEIKQHLSRLIDFFSKTVPDSHGAAEDLWKFAKMHDRRCYSLIRYCMSDESEYQKIYKSYRELRRRLQSLPSATATLPRTVSLLLYRVSNWFYNRSHIQPIMQYAQNERDPLAPAAHELLRDISVKNPGSFKAHGQELCAYLEAHAPHGDAECDPGTLDALKACASFAGRYPDDVSKSRSFVQALVQYAVQGKPAVTAKYAVSIIMASTDKREMYAKDLTRKCVGGFSFGSEHFLARLATLSQLMLLASKEMDETKDVDPVLDIALKHVLSRNCTPKKGDEVRWREETSQDCEANIWALKILANRLRSYDDAESVQEISGPVYKLLDNLIVNDGALIKKPSATHADRTRLRLEAALVTLKLCSHSDFDTLLMPEAFNHLAFVAQDTEPRVRELFVTKIKKYLGQERLRSRFYTVIFLLAFEPLEALRRESLTWLRSRAAAFAKSKKGTMEPLLARFLSLLAHHPDFSSEAESLKENVRYVTFYLQAVATPENISLLYHVAQRVKSVEDGIDASKSDNLYYLADVSVAVISHYSNIHNWTLQAYTGKTRMPSGIFAALPNHAAAQAIATKQYLGEDDRESIEALVRACLKTKKRKADNEPEALSNKKRAGSVAKSPGGSTAKSSKALPIRKSSAKKPSAKRPSRKAERAESDEGGSASVERRRSGRGAGGPKSYAEADESDDDSALETWSEEQASGDERLPTRTRSEMDKENSLPTRRGVGARR